MAFNRELSQFANYLELDAGANYIGIATNTNDANVGIGSATPESKLTVTGDAKISGVVTATSFDGALVGNADSASVLETARTISLSGDLGGSVSFDGSQDITITATVQPDSVDLGTDTVGNYVRELQAVGGSGIAVIDGTGEGALAKVELTDTGVTAGTTGSSTEIPVITVDSKGRITSVSTTDVGTTLTVEGDSGSASIDLLTETLSFKGGANITSSATSGGGATPYTWNLVPADATFGSILTDGSPNESYGLRVSEFTGRTGDTISFSPLVASSKLVFYIPQLSAGNDNAYEFILNGSVSLGAFDKSIAKNEGGNGIYDVSSLITFPFTLTSIQVLSTNSPLSNGYVDISAIEVDNTVVNGSYVTPGTADEVSFALDSDISLNTVTATEFNTGAEGSAIRVSSDTISGPATLTLDPAGVGDNTGKVVIAGDLQVDGTQTIVNSTTITVDDKNISLADGATNDAEADGGGITIQSGEGDKTFQFESNGDNFGSSENMNLADGKSYKIDNVDILSQTALGDSVVESSLTSVGNLEQLNVLGIVTASSFVATNGTFDLTGNVTGNLDGIAENASGILTARDFTISGDATAPAVSFDGRQNVDLNLTLADTGVVSSAYGSSVKIPRIVVDSKGRITGVTELTGDLLEKAGGAMSGDITFGGGTQAFDSATMVTTSGEFVMGWDKPADLFRNGDSDRYIQPKVGTELTFSTPIPVTSSIAFYGFWLDNTELLINGQSTGWYVNEGNPGWRYFNFGSDGNGFTTDAITSIGLGQGNSTSANSYARLIFMQVDGSIFDEGTLITGATSTTLALDGTAEFSGNVTASTAPTADAHLANKAYVDSLDSANSADIAANAAAIAAETSARVAADTTFSTNLAAEEAARIAADATKLPLAGGTMTGAINLGTVATPPGFNDPDSPATLTGTTFSSGYDSWRTMILDEFKTSGKHYIEFTIDVLAGSITLGVVEEFGLNTASKRNRELGRYSNAVGWRSGGELWKEDTSQSWNSGSPTFAQGDVIGVLLDKDANTVQFSKNGELIDTVISLPSNGTGYTFASSIYNTGGGPTELTYQLSTVQYLPDGYTLISGGSGGTATTIAVDGSATFGGLVSAATAPTSDEHLTNKAYVDAKAQTNADAITALVGGAPELLNTLDELAQALSDDENFATTVTNQITTETAARTAADTAEETARISADNTLTAAIAAEESARIAADATKLPLAGGSMSGDIEFGGTGVTTDSFPNNPFFNPSLRYEVLSNGRVRYKVGDPLTLSEIRITPPSGGRVTLNKLKWQVDGNYANVTDSSEWTISGHGSSDLGLLFDGNQATNFRGSPDTTLVLSLNTPKVITFLEVYISDTGNNFEFDFGSAPASTIAVDGSATFGGNITASTVPTADAHLTNKLYVDGLTSANTANIATNTTNIAANTAAIAAEETARIAADALKLDLAGGQMSGDLEVGQGTGPNPSINVISAIGSVSDLTVSGASGGWTTAAASLAKTMANGGKHYFEVFLGANSTGGWIGVTGEASDADIDISGPSNSYVEAVPFHDDTTHTKHLVSGNLYDGGSSTSNGVSAGAGDILGVLVDASGDAPWTIGYTVNGVDAGSESIDYPWSDTYRPVLSIGTGDVTFRFKETDIEYLPTGYSAWVPTAPSVNLKTDGTASFAGNVTAALAPSSGDHLANKTYVDSSVSTANTNLTAAISAEEAARIAADTTETNARIAADTTLTNDLATETAARIANDALKLDLAGGLMTGDLELGSAPPTPLVSEDYSSSTDVSNWESGPGSNSIAVNNNRLELTTNSSLSNNGNIWRGYYIVWDTTPGQQYTMVLESEPSANGNASKFQLVLNDAENPASSPKVTFDYINPGTEVTNYTFTAESNKAALWTQNQTGLTDTYYLHQLSITPVGGSTGSLTTIGIDGTATFGGHVTAATAPTSGDHLTNKTYVDAKAQANADAIEAVVGGAPELLNTLNELAQAISDDEAFATTVTNQIAAETTARQASDVTLQSNIDAEAATRLANDNTLQSNIDAEEAARIANDALKLDLAGGTMSGDLEIGSITSSPVDALLHPSGQRIGDFDAAEDASVWTTNGFGATVSVTDGYLLVNSSSNSTYGIGAYYTFDTIPGTVYTIVADVEPINGNGEFKLMDGTGILEFGGATHYEGRQTGTGRDTLTWTFTAQSANSTFSIGCSRKPGEVRVHDLAITYTPEAAGVLIGADGTATFGGLVSAALAPSSGDHLANKTYVDGEVTSANTALTAAIAAEEAARIAADTTEANTRSAADTVLTTNLANEVANRQAGDALKLDLAGGTMSGAINFGGTGVTTDSFENRYAYYGNPNPATRRYIVKSTGNVFYNQDGSVHLLSEIRITAAAGESVRVAKMRYSDAEYSYSDVTNSADWTVTGITGESDVANMFDGATGTTVVTSIDGTITITPNTPLEITSFEIWIDGQGHAVEVDWGSPSAATVNVDGTATFGGLVSAATAPTSGSHLTNKTYVDASSATLQANINAEAATRLANDNTLQANIDAEEAARIAAVSAETTARTNADTVLTNSIATESAARIANDALKLDLAGGTMSGAINMGSIGGTYEPNYVNIGSIQTAGGNPINKLFDPANYLSVETGNSDPVTGGGVSFTPITATTSLEFRQVMAHEDVELVINQGLASEVVVSFADRSFTDVNLADYGATFPLTLENVIFRGSFNGGTSLVLEVVIDGVLVTNDYQVSSSGSVIGVDGTATFSGLVSAATAPTSDEHLTNKAYVDAKAQTNADAIAAVVGGAPELLNTLDELAQALSDDENFATTVTNQIAAETTARTNADTVLTNSLANEVANRQAGDALKLDLAGGTMSGAVNFGSVGAPGSVNSVVLDGQKTYIIDRGVDFANTHLDFEGDFTGVEYNFHTDGTTWYGGTLTPDDFNQNLTNKSSFNVDNSRYLKTKTSFTGSVTLSADSSNGSNLITVYELNVTAPSAANISWINGSDLLATYVIGIPSAGATINTDGTATFSGNLTAATAPTADEHLTNKLYVDGLDAAQTASSNNIVSTLTQEIADRKDADALKLDLAGGTMTGAINLGANVGGNGFEYSDLSAASFEAVNTFGSTVTISDHASGIEIVKGARDGWVARLPFNPTIGEANTVSYQIVGDGDITAVVKANVVRVPSGVDGSGSTFTNQYAIPGELDLMGGDDYGEESLKISGLTQQSGTFTFTPTDASGDYFIYFKLTGDDKFYIGDLSVTPLSAGSAASVLGVDGTATFGDKVTVGSLEIDGALTDVNDATGNNGYILKSVGTGVEWIDILSVLPQSRTTANFTATAGQTVFAFDYNVGYIDVYVNGVKLSTNRGEFNADNGSTVTLTESLFAGDHVEMISFNTQGVGVGSVNSTADLTDVELSGTAQNDILTYDGSKFVNGQTLNLSGSVTAHSFSGIGLELTGLNASELTTGTVSAARLGSGTADATTFLRGDNTWAVVDSTTLKDSNNVTRVAATTSGATVTGDLDLGTGTLNAGDVVLTGNLIVNGTTTTLNTAELAVEDTNITVAKNATSGAEADGAGLTVAGANATLTYAAAGDRFAFNKSVTASTFIGDLLGNVTGNANTATALATPRTIGGVSFDGSANIDLPGVNISGNQNTSGNAATATALLNKRTIGGVSFDGSANIDLPGVNAPGNQDTSGNAATASTASQVTMASGSGTFYPAMVAADSGSQNVISNTGLSFNTGTGLLTVSGRVAAQDFNATSDITLKDNVSIIDNALEMINNLDGISWNWKNNGKASLGVSAQNVETVAPELVGQGEYKSVNYNGLVGVLIEAVKTLSAEVEMLKTTKSDRRIRKSA